MKTWLIIDTPFLSWRAFHTTGGLRFESTPTGVYYGVLAAIIKLESEFRTTNFAFTFDYGKSIRKTIVKEYKANRYQEKDLSKTQLRRLQEVREQIKGLRTKILPQIGFSNIFWQKGFEADDIIASLCQSIKSTSDSAVVVTADQDLFQVLSNQVEVYNPITKRLWTRKNFKRHFGISPKQWSEVKAISGCSSDNIKGVAHCGQKTAIKYLNGLVPEHHRSYKCINSEFGQNVIARNRELVRLPFPGTKTFKLRQDVKHDWHETMHELGIKTLDERLHYEERDLLTYREKKKEPDFYG